VRYECSADPLFMGNCHCRDCQKASGSAYDPDIGLPVAALKITGMVKYYDSKADSGNTLGVRWGLSMELTHSLPNYYATPYLTL